MMPRVVAAGDSTLVVEFDDRIAVDVNAQAIGLARYLERLKIAGIRDIVPTFRTVAVAFDPLVTDASVLTDTLKKSMRSSHRRDASASRVITVPVCYDEAFAPDLARVAERAGADRASVIGWHAAGEYHVFMLGFTPGFAYMGSVDPRIATPRLESPRTKVVAGSVGIAGEQTGIYPADTPGGWNIIGRTPLRIWRDGTDEPALFKAGDTVRFEPIDRATFDQWPGRSEEPA